MRPPDRDTTASELSEDLMLLALLQEVVPVALLLAPDDGLFGPAEAVVEGALTFNVVVALPLPFKWPAADAVTVVMSVPEVCPDLALTVRAIAEEVEPGATVNEEAPRAEALNELVLLSVTESV